ncbi:MAG: metal ABC transporter ATP-binding protein [Myxococcota bacterium]
MEAALEVDGLTASYDEQPVVDDVSFTVERGDLVGIVGPNGAGKSTMIKAIVGAHRPDAGTVRVLGDRGKKAIRRVTYVPQQESVDWDFPVTVHDVVKQGRYGHVGLLGRLSREDHAAIDEALDFVGMQDYVDRQIGELSGGQRQRVFLARALAQKGEVYLLDEPFVGVDAATEKAIVEVLRRLQDQGRAVMVVHHDLATVREYFDKLLLMNAELIAYGTVEQTFTTELLQQTYGGKLTVLDGADAVIAG